jgi:cell division protease FtsH
VLAYETLRGVEINNGTAGEKLGGDDDSDKPSGGETASVVSIPKTKPKTPKSGLEPEPSA